MCPIEITAFNDKASEFHNVESLQCQVDSYFSHLAQINTLRKNGGLDHMNIMLLSDMTKQTSRDQGVLFVRRSCPCTKRSLHNWPQWSHQAFECQ